MGSGGARTALAGARAALAACLGAEADEVCFTSGGTEANNLAILGRWRAARLDGRTAVLTTPIEHKAVLEAVRQAEREGARVRMVDVDSSGVAPLASLRAVLADDIALVSVGWVNNEIGTRQPLTALAEEAAERGAAVHTDAVQAFGKVHIDARAQRFDLLTISGHKIGAPKGIGALYVRRGVALEPILYGGEQGGGRRPGTENVALAVGLARAAELTLAEQAAEVPRLLRLRDQLQTALAEALPEIVIHGSAGPRASHIVNVSIPGVDAATLLMALDRHGIAASAGSACQGGHAGQSHVLHALGVAPELIGAAIRLSLGVLTSDASVSRAVSVIVTLVRQARGN